MVQVTVLALLIGESQLLCRRIAMQAEPHGPLFLRHPFVQIIRLKPLKLICRIAPVLPDSRPSRLRNRHGGHYGNEGKKEEKAATACNALRHFSIVLKTNHR